MDWLSADDYWLARLVFQRLLGLVYLIAFTSALNQFVPLAGERGLLPAPRYLGHISFRRAPTLFHLHYSDRFARSVAAAGVVLSAAVVLGVVDRLPLGGTMAVWMVLWCLYLSFVNAGQIWFGFVWETLLVEAGFLAVLLGNGRTAPVLPAVLLVRWLLFRLEVGAGLIKVRNDPAWRDLTALHYHHETQPLPNRFSPFFHHLPRPLHKVEAAANHVVQLIVPVALFLPQPIGSAAGAVVVATQLWLMLSGNFAWLNLLTITLAATAFDDRSLGHLLPWDSPSSLADPPRWFTFTVLVVSAAMVALSWRPVRNMASRHQVMNASYNPLHLGNTYGLFGHITRNRLEVILEGTADSRPGADTRWEAYEFKAKPGDVRRRPRQVAPYHLRLDWLMWFAALSPAYAHGWLRTLVAKLLANDPATLRLIDRNPFPDRPPRAVRALLYHYRCTTPTERKRTGAWWERQLLDVYLPPVIGPAPPTVRGTTARP